MKALLKKWIAQRDFHLAQAKRYDDAIHLAKGDEASISDITKIMAQAHTLASNGNGETALKEKPHGSQTPEARARASRRMKRLWKEKRAEMLKKARANARHAHEVMRERRAAEE